MNTHVPCDEIGCSFSASGEFLRVLMYLFFRCNLRSWVLAWSLTFMGFLQSASFFGRYLMSKASLLAGAVQERL